MNSSGFNQLFTLFSKFINYRTLLAISPLFLLTVKHWTNGVLLVLFFGALIFLIKSNRGTGHYSTLNLWKLAILFMFCGPFLAVAISQILRLELYPPNFDAPLRIALCSVIFYAVATGWLHNASGDSITRIWGTTVIPLTLLWTLLFRPAWTNAWGTDRIVTYFVDPLSFGSTCLVFAFISLTSAIYYWRDLNWLIRFLCICGTTCGFYLSIKSGSRTGWINLPVFLGIWTYFIGLKKFGPFRTLSMIAIGGTLILIAIFSQPLLSNKIDMAINEIKNYNWSTMNTDGSVTMRLSFYRMAIFYFFESPFAGWGDLGWMKIMNSRELMIYASEFTRDYPKNGFHNEILTSAVRSGICGLFASLSFFLLPIIWAITSIKNARHESVFFCALICLIFIVHQFLAGMTTEVTNLVFLASFLGLTLATIIGEGMYLSNVNENSAFDKRT
jgi:O-antigen ligase